MHGALGSQPIMCEQSVPLQLAAICVFLFITFNNVDDMFRHFKATLLADAYSIEGTGPVSKSRVVERID